MSRLNSNLMAAFTAAALLLGAVHLRADEKGGHDHSHAASDTSKGQGIMSSHDGMTSLYGHVGAIEKDLAAGKLETIHDHSEALAASVKDLDKDTTLNAAKKKRVQGYVKNVLKIADKLHHHADDKKLEPARKELKKLQAQVDLLDKQFAHSHKPGAAEPKKEGEGHHAR